MVSVTKMMIQHLTFVRHLFFSKRMPSINEEHNVDDVHANHNDHDEGLWENIPT